MRHTAFSFAVLILSAHTAAACELPETRPHAEHFETRGALNTRVFAETVAEKLGNSYMGYAVTLRGKAGNIIARINHGYARTPCEPDGEQVFTGATQSPIGSVSKALTASVVVHRAEVLDSVSLDDPFGLYLPKKWQGDLHKSLAPVTLSDLLRHMAGFAKSGENLWGHDFSFRERLSLGEESYLVAAKNIAKDTTKCLPEPKEKRCYSNTSFALWNVSAASLLPRKWKTVEDGYSPGEITYDSYVTQHAFSKYRDLVQKVLFDPVSVTGGCNAYTDTENFALNYKDRDTKRGKNNTEEGRPCAIGGWFMSTRALSKVIHRVVATREVIDQNHDEMFRNNDLRIVFATKRGLPDGSGFSHNGSRFDGTAKAEVIVFPNGMVAAAIANSNRTGTGTKLINALADGYRAGLPQRTNP